MTRPDLFERHPGWGGATVRNATTLTLEPLGAEPMRELLHGLVPGLPEDAVTSIVARAEGVPLYAVETVRMLIDRGQVVPAGDGYALAGPLPRLAVPETLQALVAARIDTNDPADRAILADAAVLGQILHRGRPDRGERRHRIGPRRVARPARQARAAHSGRRSALAGARAVSVRPGDHSGDRVRDPGQEGSAGEAPGRGPLLRGSWGRGAVRHPGQPLPRGVSLYATPDRRPTRWLRRRASRSGRQRIGLRACTRMPRPFAITRMHLAVTQDPAEIAQLHERAALIAGQVDLDAVFRHGRAALDGYRALKDTDGELRAVAELARGLTQLREVRGRPGAPRARRQWSGWRSTRSGLPLGRALARVHAERADARGDCHGGSCAGRGGRTPRAARRGRGPDQQGIGVDQPGNRGRGPAAGRHCHCRQGRARRCGSPRPEQPCVRPGRECGCRRHAGHHRRRRRCGAQVRHVRLAVAARGVRVYRAPGGRRLGRRRGGSRRAGGIGPGTDSHGHAVWCPGHARRVPRERGGSP